MHFLICFVCLCLIASATALHFTTIYLGGGNVCDFTTLNLQYFSCLCVCNVLLKYIVWSSNTKKNLGIGWESRSRSMEIWQHDFFCSEFWDQKILGVGWESQIKHGDLMSWVFHELDWVHWERIQLVCRACLFQVIDSHSWERETQISWCVFVGILEVFVLTTKAWRMMMRSCR